MTRKLVKIAFLIMDLPDGNLQVAFSLQPMDELFSRARYFANAVTFSVLASWSLLMIALWT